MTRSRARIALVAVFALAAAFWVGMMASGDSSADRSAETADAKRADAAVDRAEAAVADAQKNYDRAMADLSTPYPSHSYRPDPAMQMRERHVIELNEMICNQTGQSCEFARMMRRQYQETYGR